MRTLILLTLSALLAAGQTKQAPPAPTAPRPFEFPKAAFRTLANGLRVYVVEDHRLPLVSASLQVLAGNANVAPEKSGLASMTAGLLREGTSSKSSQQIAKLIDNAGGSLSASAGDDVATIGMSFMKSYAGLGMELMADIARNPAFAQEEIDRQMRQAQSNLAVQYADAQYLAPLAASRAILGTHPYAYPGDGTPQTLGNIKREEIVAFYKANYAPGRGWMAIAGDVTAEEGFALAEKYFGSWSGAAAADVKLPAPPAAKPQVLIVDMANAVQTQIVVGHLGVPRNHPDYIALTMANQIFGGSFNSRLNMKLRANEGLTYGASSGFEPNRQAGTFQCSTFTRTEKTAEAIRFIVDLLKEFKQNPATETEFNEAKAYMIGKFGLDNETAGAVATRTLVTAVYGLPEDYYVNYRRTVQAITRQQVGEAVQRFLQPERMAIVAVGNSKEFAKALESYGPVRVIKSDEIDFVAPGLVKEKAKVELSAAAAAAAAAQGKGLVSAAVAAMGGLEKLKSIKDISTKGKLKLTLPQGTYDAETETQILYPDRYKTVMKLPMATITQALDGASAWMGQGAMTQDMPAQLTAELAKGVSSAAGGIGLWLAAEAGKAEVHATGADSVLWKSGDVEVRVSFDEATHLPVKMAMKTIGMTGPAEIENVFSDFREVDGLKMAFATSVTQNGQKVGEGTTSEVKFNSGLKAESFAKPKAQ
ncbi:MAG: insulinase family protein [Candidatus Solibacter usitatus]|nr:insulinase family protein [Candidatus Solibacter usitatus]